MTKKEIMNNIKATLNAHGISVMSSDHAPSGSARERARRILDEPMILTSSGPMDPVERLAREFDQFLLEQNEVITRFYRSEYERVENQRDSLRDEVEQLRKELTDVRKYCDDILSVLAFTVDRMTLYRDKVEGKEKEDSSDEKE